MTTTLQSGEKRKLADLTSGTTVEVTVEYAMDGLDVSVFGLDADRKLADDRYFVFYNQPQSPGGEIRAELSAGRATFRLDLGRLPANVSRLMFVATHDERPVSGASRLAWSLGGAAFDPRGALRDEKAVMIAELYLHGGEWRVAAVGQGFAGGLQALLEYFGGQAIEDAPAASASPAAPAAPPPPAAPAVSLKKQTQVRLDKQIEREAPQLVNLVKSAEVSLKKRGLDEHTAKVALVLDISGSMYDEYQSGAVQKLAERALALGTRFDDDGQIDVFLFGVRARHVGSVGVSEITGYVDRLMRGVNLEGGTKYGEAMKLVRRHYFGNDGRQDRPAPQRLPVYVMFVTDGGTQDRKLTEDQMRFAAYEPCFWKFMGIEQGSGGSREFEFLQRLDDLTGRYVDNADFFSVRDPARVPDGEMYELLLREYDVWLAGAKGRGLLF